MLVVVSAFEAGPGSFGRSGRFAGASGMLGHFVYHFRCIILDPPTAYKRAGANDGTFRGLH